MKTFRSFNAAVAHSDALRKEINSHPSVASHHEKFRASFALNKDDSPEHHAAYTAYKDAFEKHPKAAEYHNAIKRALKLP